MRSEAVFHKSRQQMFKRNKEYSDLLDILRSMYESAQLRAFSSIHTDLKPGARGKESTGQEVASLLSTPGTHLIFIGRANEAGDGS